MDRLPYVRYIGFPTSSSATHARYIKDSYSGLTDLLDPSMRVPVPLEDRYLEGGPRCKGTNSSFQVKSETHQFEQHMTPSLVLQPLIFWYDSTHLAHVRRYLEIYKPFLSLSLDLQTQLGPKRVKEFKLRDGDFIGEDTAFLTSTQLLPIFVTL
jgi:hypothetical protein